MRASTTFHLALVAASVAPALALPFGNARPQAIPASPMPPTPYALGAASSLAAPHLPVSPNVIPGMHRKHAVHKSEHEYHEGPHAHGTHGHYDHGDHRRPGDNHRQRGPHSAHHHWHAGEHGGAGAHDAHRPYAGVHSPQHAPVGQQPEQNKPTAQMGMVPQLRAGARHPAGVTVGLAAKPHAHHPEGVQPTPAGEPRAFDEELFARALADGLVTRKVTFGEVMGDLAHFLKREDDGLRACVDEDEKFVARDALFGESD